MNRISDPDKKFPALAAQKKKPLLDAIKANFTQDELERVLKDRSRTIEVTILLGNKLGSTATATVSLDREDLERRIARKS